MQLPDFLFDYGGEIRLTGHRIGLYTLVRDYQEGRSVEEIAAEYPSLEPGLAQKVIDFYLANPEEVNKYVEEFRAEMERIEAAHPPSPETLRMREQLRKLVEAETRTGKTKDEAYEAVLTKMRTVGVKKLLESI